MVNLNKNNKNKHLKTRYLIWLYKTTKEPLDRIDRKFTQLEIDKFMFNKIEAILRRMQNKEKETYKKNINQFLAYIENKEKEALRLQLENGKPLNSNYKFLKLKLCAIESAIKKFIGKKYLINIRFLYQQEMIKRILEEKQHT